MNLFQKMESMNYQVLPVIAFLLHSIYKSIYTVTSEPFVVKYLTSDAAQSFGLANK